MAKDSKDHTAGNTDPEKRGKGIKEETAIGQRIPKSVRKQIEPKEEGK